MSTPGRRFAIPLSASGEIIPRARMFAMFSHLATRVTASFAPLLAELTSPWPEPHVRPSSLQLMLIGLGTLAAYSALKRIRIARRQWRALEQRQREMTPESTPAVTPTAAAIAPFRRSGHADSLGSSGTTRSLNRVAAGPRVLHPPKINLRIIFKANPSLLRVLGKHSLQLAHHRLVIRLPLRRRVG